MSNFKNVSMSLLSVFLMVSCTQGGSTTSSQANSTDKTSSTSQIEKSTSLTSNMLLNIKKGYKSEGILNTVTKTNNGYTTTNESTYNYLDYQTNGQDYSFEGYQANTSETNITRDKLIDSGYIVSHDTKASLAYLGIDNVVHYEDLTNSYATSDDKSLVFLDSGFANPFSLTNHYDFTKTLNDYEFTFDTSNFTNQVTFGFGLIGSTKYSLSKFLLHTDGYKITDYEATYAPYSLTTSSKETLTIKATVTDFGNAEVKKVVPSTQATTTDLYDDINKLKNYNYQVNTQYYDLTSGSESLMKASYSADIYNNQVDIIASSIYGVKSHFAYYEKGNYIYQAYKIADNYYQYLDATSYTLATLLPTFDISDKVFDQNDNVFTLQKRVPAITPSCQTYDMFLGTNVSDLTITLNTDSIVFTNVGTEYKTVTTYTNIGTTTSPFVVNDIKSDCSALTWKQLFENQKDVYDELVTFCKSETIVNLIPTVGLQSPYSVIGIDDTYREIIVPLGRDQTSATSVLSTYITKLTAAGWGELEVQLTGAYQTTYTSSIKVSSTLSVTPYLDLFTMADTSGIYYLYIYVYLNI